MSKAEFLFTDEEFLATINMIIKMDTPLGEKFTPLNSLEDKFSLYGLDSLSIMVFFVWISTLFGIKEEIVHQFVTDNPNFTGIDLRDFVKAECTIPITYERAKKESEAWF